MLRCLAALGLVLILPVPVFALPVAGQPSTPNSGPTGWAPPPPSANAPISEGGAIINVDSETTHPSIQDAVQFASPGDTLEVLSSVHGEGLVVIDRSLTLRGATGTETVMANTSTGDAGDARAWFLVQPGVQLEVQDLTFDGAGYSIHQAFRHQGSGSFDNVRFRAIQFNPSGPNYAGAAIVAFGDGPVDVRDSHFSQIGRQGIFYFGSAVSGSVAENNAYIGKGDGDFLDYGIEAGGGADVILQGNTVSDCRGEASIDGSNSAAILVTTFFGPGTAAVIESNSMTFSTAGLIVGYAGQPESSVVTASFNRIVGNDLGLQSGSSNPVTAENNWWGCNDGPGSTGCDVLDGTGTIQADPHLTLTLMASNTTLQVGDTASLDAELFRNSQGDDTLSLGNVPDGIETFFDGGSLGTVAPALTTTQGAVAVSVFTAETPGTDVIRTTIDGQAVFLPITVEGSGGGTPLLFVREEIVGVTGEQVVVPVEFGGGGLDISAVAWSTDFDETCLAFDPTDADLDGLPDAIEFLTSAEFVPSVFVDLADGDGELDILLADLTVPLATLTDGVLANITFTVECDPGNGSVLAPVGFSSDPSASFGNTLGQDVPGTSTDGSVLVVSGLRGDCNGDGFVSAGDISACTLEVFDADGNFWLDVPGSTFAGNPVGCDANADTVVDAGDVSCKNRIIFGLPCDPTSPELGGAAPSWSLPYGLTAEDSAVQVPITLSTQGQAISSTVFSLHLDRQRVRFDDRDEDGNGIPDAATFSGDANVVSVFPDAVDDGIVHVLVADLSASPRPLQDGDRLTLELEVLPGVTDVQGAVAFRSAMPVSFGTPLGGSIPGQGNVAGSGIFQNGFESGGLEGWSTSN